MWPFLFCLLSLIYILWVIVCCHCFKFFVFQFCFCLLSIKWLWFDYLTLRQQHMTLPPACFPAVIIFASEKADQTSTPMFGKHKLTCMGMISVTPILCGTLPSILTDIPSLVTVPWPITGALLLIASVRLCTIYPASQMDLAVPILYDPRTHLQ